MSVHDACTLYAGGCLRNIALLLPQQRFWPLFVLFFSWRLIVLLQQHCGVRGAAVVRRWSAYIHLRLVRGQVGGSWSTLPGIAPKPAWICKILHRLQPAHATMIDSDLTMLD